MEKNVNLETKFSNGNNTFTILKKMKYFTSIVLGGDENDEHTIGAVAHNGQPSNEAQHCQQLK